MSTLLQGAYDLHVHAAPDIVGRKYDDFELAERYLAAGMKGFAIKAHQFHTAARSQIVTKSFPGCNAVGGITLNQSVGGINPVAVETAARMGAKIVWFPTVHAQKEYDFLRRFGQEKPYGAGVDATVKVKRIPVLENGTLTEGCEEVLRVIKQYNLVLATGHIAPEETLALIKRGKELGLEKMIATHVSFPTTLIDIELQKQLVACGAVVEHCYYTPHFEKCSFENIFQQIRSVGCEHVILTSDMGQTTSPDPVDGLLDFAEKAIRDGGFSEEDVRKMIVHNPAALVE